MISLSLEYLPNGVDPASLPTDIKQQHQRQQLDSNDATTASRRYLNCPALVIIAYLKKFLALKYNIDVTRYNIDICHKNTPLPEDWTLMDVAYIFAWKRVSSSRSKIKNLRLNKIVIYFFFLFRTTQCVFSTA